MKLSEARVAFIFDKQIHRQSHYTLRHYTWLLLKIQKIIGDISIEQLNMRHIDQIRIFLLRRKASTSTIHGYFITLRSLLRWCIGQGLKVLAPEKIELGRSKSRRLTVLTIEEVHKIIRAIDTSTTEGIRNRAIIELLFASGIRVGELVGLNTSDIDLANLQFSVLGKGKKVRVCFLTESAATWIKKWLKNKPYPYTPLFTSLSNNAKKETQNNYGRLHNAPIQSMVKEYSRLANIEKHVTPHVFRHTYATALLQRGCDLKSLQEMLGHSSLESTEIYLHVSPVQLQRTYHQFFPC